MPVRAANVVDVAGVDLVREDDVGPPWGRVFDWLVLGARVDGDVDCDVGQNVGRRVVSGVERDIMLIGPGV